MNRRLKLAWIGATLLVEQTVKDTVDREMRAELEALLPDAETIYRRLQAKLDKKRHKLKLNGLPRPLRELIAELVERLGENFRALAENNLGLGEWFDLVKRALQEYHLAGWMLGAGSETVPERAWRGLVTQVNAQLEYLRKFKLEIQTDQKFEKGWQERAESYANSVKQPYWKGRTKLLPLPAMPAQGTQCLENCCCKWEITTLDEKAEDYDCYWRLEPGKEHCQTCEERAEQWNPVKIRGGVLQ